MLKWLILKILLGYKRYFSWGYHCRFVPSCSEYVYQAIDKYGVVKGGWMGMGRVLRCNPWTKGGIDMP